MTSLPVAVVKNVVDREVRVSSYSEFISCKLFSDVTAPSSPPTLKGVTTELQFKSGLPDSIVAAAA